MSIKSKIRVIKSSKDGSIYVAGEPEFVGKLPTKPPDLNDPEFQELEEAIDAVRRAGNENN